MNRYLHISMAWGIVLVLSACNLRTTATPNPVLSQTPVLNLTVQVQNPTETFDAVGDVINYNYTITNTGSQPLAGPVTVNDNIATAACPELSTVGNQNDTLDPGETITCSGSHTLTQADLDARQVINTVTASAAGGTAFSAPGGVTVNLISWTPGKALGLAKTASPLTYNQAGQTITYTYVITNTGSLAVGPAQFVITDDRMGGPAAPFTCGADGTTLNPGETVTCTAPYTISQQDMGSAR